MDNELSSENGKSKMSHLTSESMSRSLKTNPIQTVD